ncbi:unnamed protein product [Paramecium octaurelia]|uniref:Transmembrane protein n=1 Tax=Paramecium octaurelia TaxID=43137 RepID=A0A8S1VSR9_PAROT|nr:unnamed protein product [Paramecium octaurelia]
MQQILNTIDKVDIFGFPVSLLTPAKASLYQSKLGGIITILIGGISITYFLYFIIQWIDRPIPASISIKQQTISYAEFQLSDSIIQLELQDFSGDADPFRKEHNIITPNLYRILNSKIIDKPIPLFSSEDRPFTLSIDKGTIVLNHDSVGIDDHIQMTQLLLVLESCSNLTPVSGSYCAATISQTIMSQFINLQLSKQKHEFKSLGCYLFRIDNISVNESITLPKLGQILAQVGSIVQVIFLLKYIAIYYNNMLLENELLHEIVTMYYPEMKKNKLNLFNQFEYQNQNNLEENVDRTLENFKYKYKAFIKRAKEKCRPNNILYEISRLYIIYHLIIIWKLSSAAESLNGRKIIEQLFRSLIQQRIKQINSQANQFY